MGLALLYTTLSVPIVVSHWQSCSIRARVAGLSLEPRNRLKVLKYTCCSVTSFSKYRCRKISVHVDRLHSGLEPGRGGVTSQRQGI